MVFKFSELSGTKYTFHLVKSVALLFVMLGVLMLVSSSLQAQDPAEELKLFIKAQQAKMDEQSKVLEQQKILILEQSKLLKEQSERQNPTSDPELPATPKFSLEPKELQKLPSLEELTDITKETTPNRRGPNWPVKDNGMMATWGKDGRLTFESEDKAFKARIGGLFQMDFGFYSIDPYAQKLLPDSGLQQGSEFRRARLRSDGNFCTYMEWVFEMDFSRASDNRRDILTAPDPNVTFNNVFVGMHDIPFFGTIRVGHIKEELSFYSASSGRNIPFMERPGVWDAIEDPYLFSNGITISNTYLEDHVYSWVGLFQTNTRTGAFAASDTAELAFDARLCVMPFYDEPNNHWLNLGSTGSVRANPRDLLGDNKGLPVAISNVAPLIRAGSSFQVPNLINSKAFFTRDGTELYTLCLNYANGPFSLGAQYDGQFFDNAYVGGLPNSNGTLPENVKPIGNLYFDGYSIEMLCFLTNGDHRGINKMDPMYSQVIPVKNFSFGHGKGEQGSGAWEIGTKFDFIKSQFNVPDEKPRGGYLSSITLGLNWYLNPNAFIMTNYVYTTGFFGTNGPDNAAFHSFGSRFQFTF
ncbi:MAG: porin [Planctomycetota bacterium]